MSSEWQTIPLGDVLELVIDHRGKTPKKLGFEDFHASGYPVLSAKHVKTSGLVNNDSIRFANQFMYEKWMRVPVRKGDIVLTSEAPMGETYYIDGSIQYVLGQRVFGLRPDTDLIEPLYLLTWLSSDTGKSQLQARATGSTVQGIKQSELLKIEIELPPLEVQKIISKNQSAFSSKIYLNHQINQTLEQMAQAIFKSWFVDFEPAKAKIAALEAGGTEEDALLAAMQAISGKTQAELSRIQTDDPEKYAELRATAELFPSAMQDSELGEIPEGWAACNFANICDFQNGYAFKSKDWSDSGSAVVKIGSVKPGFVDLKSCSYVEESTTASLGRFELFAGDLLVGMTGYPGETGLVPHTGKRIFLNQRVGRLKPKSAELAALLYCNARASDFKRYVEGQAHGSAQANVSGRAICQYPLIIPDHATIKSFSKIITPMLNKKLRLNMESNDLAVLRDTLLPRLLSGEIRPSEHKINVTEVKEMASV